MNWILERAQERSTIATILTGITGILGWTFMPEFQEEVITAVAAIASAIAIATKEEK